MGSSAALSRAVSGLRNRWRTWVLLTVLVALAGGAIGAVAAGARRAESAYPRLLQAERAADVFVYLDAGAPARLRQGIAQLPEVADAASALGLAPGTTDFTPVVLTDPRLGRDLNRFKLLAGRLPRRADEALVGFMLADSRHLHVGSRFVLRPPATTPGPPATVTVVGIEAAPQEFPPLPYGTQRSLYLAPPFLHTASGRAWTRQTDGSAVMLAVRLRAGAHQEERFLADAQRLAGGPVGTGSQADQTASIERSMRFQSVALWLLAAIAALVVAVVLAQLLLRQLGDDASDNPTWRALGMTSGELLVSDALRVTAVGVAGATGAMVVAWLASPLFPLGTARVAEPHPGLAFDSLAIGAGAVILAVAVAAVGAGAAWAVTRRSAARRAGRPGDESSVSRRVDLRRLPVVPATGIRLALRAGHGSRATPVRTTIGAVALGIGSLAAALTFGASLQHLLDTPRLYGVTYDADVELNANFGDIRTVVPAIRADRSVAMVTVAETGIPLRSGQTSFGGVSSETGPGAIVPTIVDGRLPRTGDEIALGTSTLSQLQSAIGRTVPVAVEGITSPLPMHVVGAAVLPTFTDTLSLGKGAVLAPAALGRFLAHVPAGFPAPPPGDALVRFRPGVDAGAGIRGLTARLGGVSRVLVIPPTQPSNVTDFGQVQGLPNVLAGLLAALAAATIAYLLVSAVRRRRRELAVLKTLGFVPRQVSAAVAWQAATVAVVAAVVGIPVGVVAGRALWSAVAGQIGVLTETTVPWVALGLLLPGAVLVANLVAAAPAAVAARIAPAQALRSE